MSRRPAAKLLRARGAWLLAALCVFASEAQSAPVLPSGFAWESATPGALFDTPTSIAFFPDGRMLVAQKEGTVWMVQNGTKSGPILDIKSKVLNQADRGLLDVAVDPSFMTNRYIYVLYTVDPDSDNVDTYVDAYGRLARYQMTSTSSNVVDLTSRAILFGRTWSEGPASGSDTHTIGSLRWGVDGSLIVSAGEGAHWEAMDSGGQDGPLFDPGRTDPLEDIGAFRAQYIGSLAGKILRLNPANGQGYTSNPFYNGDPASVQSRIYAYGVRNPFRICVRPGTGNANPAMGQPGSIYIGDVGWATWEEFSIATQAGRNFGWPCREGLHTTTYTTQTPAHNDCNSLNTPTNPATSFTPPVSDWNHSNPSNSQPAGVIGNAASGSAFYTGTTYPVSYQGSYFFADYGQSWIRRATVDASDNVTQFYSFGTNMEAPVDLVPDPISKDLFYVSITAGQVRRIRYVGPPNFTPVAMAAANPTVGTAPLTVNFSSAGSYDPDADPLSFTWDFADGSGSFLANPSHVYNNSGIFMARLTVSDGHGGSGSAQVQVTVGDPGTFPSTLVLDNFNRANGAMGSPWVDVGTAVIQSNQITAPSTSSPVWTGTFFGPDQEAYYTFTTPPNSPELDINLKMQAQTKGSSHIEVKYDGAVHIATLDDTGPGWVDRPPFIPVTFNAGDQFGARVYGTNVNVYKNGTLMGTRSILGWAMANNGGFIGFTLNNAPTTKIDNFGGGNYLPVINTPPTAIIAGPTDNSFYVEGQTLNLTGNASDAQETASQMAYHWDLTLHHNNHTHPGQLVSDNRNDVFMPEDHEDGTGTWLEVKLVVTDGGGLKDTASVSVWPEVDLDPSTVTVTPDPARRIDVNNFAFKLRNYGRMLSRLSHWELLAGTTTLAEGDTLVGPLDSLAISLPVDVFLSPGNYPLRVVTDTFNVVHETNEANNARMRTLAVINGTVEVDTGPGPLSLSGVVPNPTRGRTRFWLTLPQRAHIAMTVHDVQGRQVWAGVPQDLGPGRWPLEWDAGSSRAGVYLLRVQVGETSWVRRIAVIR